MFDSPALHGDLWIALARIAAATERIGSGSGVAVAGLRHPMVTAAAAASVAEIAPGRLTLAFGTGHTARRTLGRPVRVDDLVREVRQVRSLLAGDVVDIDGQPGQMCHLPGFGPSRPLDVPGWLAASGPQATAAARDLAVPGGGAGDVHRSAALVLHRDRPPSGAATVRRAARPRGPPSGGREQRAHPPVSESPRPPPGLRPLLPWY